MLKRFVTAFLIGTLVIALPLGGAASTLSIYMTGLNLAYDGENIFSLGGVDPLISAQFVVDNALVGMSFDTGADVHIGGVYNLDTNGTSTTSTMLGHGLDLFFNDLGGFLDLDWDSAVEINLDNVSGELGIHGTAVTNDINQSLPFGLGIGTPVEVTFSQNVTYVESAQPAGGRLQPAGPSLDPSYITYFESHGTGEILAPLEPVPEPGTLVLVGVGIMGGILARRRRSARN